MLVHYSRPFVNDCNICSYVFFMKQALQNDVSQSIAGSCQTMKETKKKENWKKLFVKLEKGALTVHKNLKVSFILQISSPYILSGLKNVLKLN